MSDQPKHEIIKETALCLQVCSGGTEDEALEFLQSTNAAGTRNNWQKSDAKEHKPAHCQEFPDRKHYMFVC